MLKISTVLLTVCAIFSLSHACLGPANMEGVAFTSDEAINLQNLMNLGIEKVNYLKEGEEPNISIRYVSHYDPRAMVFVGNYGLAFQQNVRMNCMGVVLPLDDSASSYAAIDKASFDFAAAVKAELTWLAARSIVAIPAETITTIDSALSISSNGGGQYWTHAQTVLAYNSWYTYDTIAIKWSDGSDGVNGVKGVDAVRGCSIINPDSGMPPQGLETSLRVPGTRPIAVPDNRLTARRLGNGAYIVFLPRKPVTDGFVTVFDCKGAKVCTKRIPAGVQTLYISGLTFGYYTFRSGF